MSNYALVYLVMLHTYTVKFRVARASLDLLRFLVARQDMQALPMQNNFCSELSGGFSIATLNYICDVILKPTIKSYRAHYIKD